MVPNLVQVNWTLKILNSFQIPIVPKVVPRPTDPNQNHCNAAAAAAAVVPPEQINNFVYDSPHDRLVIDFGEIKFDEDHRSRKASSATLPPRPLSQQSTASSSTSSSGLLKRYGTTIRL